MLVGKEALGAHDGVEDLLEPRPVNGVVLCKRGRGHGRELPRLGFAARAHEGATWLAGGGERRTMLKMDSVTDARPLTAPWDVMPKKPAEVPMAWSLDSLVCNDQKT